LNLAYTPRLCCHFRRSPFDLYVEEAKYPISFRSVSFLLQNARSFMRAARRDLEEGEYNLALFHAEQALQLCTKYKLYLKYGDYPKTHKLKELLEALQQSYDAVIIDLLEDAYIGSRYLPVRYSAETARRAVAEVERLMREMGCLS